MKIEKKIKTFLLSSLTMFASAISVVACGSKDEGDQNYKDFVNKLEKVSFKNSIKDNTSFSSYENRFSDDKVWSTNFNISADNLKFYDITDYENKDKETITSKSLSTLEDGGITYDADGNVLLNKVSLNNILFTENFDLSVKNVKYGPKKSSMTFKDVTLFFQIKADKDKVIMIPWDDTKKKKISVWGNTTEFIKTLSLDKKHGFNTKNVDFGLANSDNQMFYYLKNDKVELKNWTFKWTGLEKEKLKPLASNHLFTVDDNDKLTINKPSGKDPSYHFSFNVKNFFACFTNVEGVATAETFFDKKVEANFVGMFSKSDLHFNNKSNFFVEVDLKNLL
ncbi:hypothetical protein JTY60_01770 [symbiont of Argiope bruennichi]|uniref:hypothetical protein n=1 Tax=symbiont of Argiope bruennichi TaxID=2810479 RepID=UPI003DA31ECA